MQVSSELQEPHRLRSPRPHLSYAQAVLGDFAPKLTSAAKTPPAAFTSPTRRSSSAPGRAPPPPSYCPVRSNSRRAPSPLFTCPDASIAMPDEVTGARRKDSRFTPLDGRRPAASVAVPEVTSKRYKDGPSLLRMAGLPSNSDTGGGKGVIQVRLAGQLLNTAPPVPTPSFSLHQLCKLSGPQ